jgi:histidyl-tRNA synthetase
VSSTSEEGKPLALGGGGRYDTLVKRMGGEQTPAIGFAIGLDRVVMRMKREKTKIHCDPKPKVFLAQLGELAKKKSLRLFARLEKDGILVGESFGRGGLKAQLRHASKIGAEITMILGQKEAIDETVIVKDMISGSQETVSQERLVEIIKKMLRNNGSIFQKKNNGHTHQEID